MAIDSERSPRLQCAVTAAHFSSRVRFYIDKCLGRCEDEYSDSIATAPLGLTRIESQLSLRRCLLRSPATGMSSFSCNRNELEGPAPGPAKSGF